MGNEFDDLLRGAFEHQRRKQLAQTQNELASLRQAYDQLFNEHNQLVDNYNALLGQHEHQSAFLQKVRNNEARLSELSRTKIDLSNRLSNRLWQTINEENRLSGLAEERIVDTRRRRLEKYDITLEQSAQAPVETLRDVNGWTIAAAVVCYRLFVLTKQDLMAKMKQLDALVPKLRADQQSEADYEALQILVRNMWSDVTYVLAQDMSGFVWRQLTIDARTYVDDSIRWGKLDYLSPDSAILTPLLSAEEATNHIVDVLSQDYGRIQRYLVERGRVPAADPLPAPT